MSPCPAFDPLPDLERPSLQPGPSPAVAPNLRYLSEENIEMNHIAGGPKCNLKKKMFDQFLLQ